MDQLSAMILTVLCLIALHEGVGVDGLATAKRGFAKRSRSRNSQDGIKTSVIDEMSKQTVRNLFSVCSHIQDPALYQPIWADACQETIVDGRKAVIATKDVKKGRALTLFPIHALGLRWLNRKNSSVRSKRESNKSANQYQNDVEFVAYDQDKDGDFLNQQSGLRVRLNIPLDKDQPAYQPIVSGKDDRVLFAMLDTSKVPTQGWLGGKIHSTQSNPGSKSNCFTLPLPGCAPLCGIIATRDIKEGEEIVKTISSPSVEDIGWCKEVLMQEYGQDLSELKQYIEMACKSPSGSQMTSPDLGPFHELNPEYPGLRKLHENPNIYVVDEFLSNDECDRLIAKASSHLRPCLIKDEATGAVELDPSRTSTDANIPQREVRSIIRKLTSLLSSDADHLEILQVLNYKEGQQFNAHTDGFQGPVSACGFEGANRVATVFTYLNDVVNGGQTVFPVIDLKITPKKGMAVVHFPSDLHQREDERTLHEGSIALDEKWLLTTWLWSKIRSDDRYSEEALPSLSSDLI